MREPAVTERQPQARLPALPWYPIRSRSKLMHARNDRRVQLGRDRKIGLRVYADPVPSGACRMLTALQNLVPVHAVVAFLSECQRGCTGIPDRAVERDLLPSRRLMATTDRPRFGLQSQGVSRTPLSRPRAHLNPFRESDRRPSLFPRSLTLGPAPASFSGIAGELRCAAAVNPVAGTPQVPPARTGIDQTASAPGLGPSCAHREFSHTSHCDVRDPDDLLAKLLAVHARAGRANHQRHAGNTRASERRQTGRYGIAQLYRGMAADQ